MAQTPMMKDSADSVARGARSHLRLTKRTGNAEALALARRMEAPLTDLVAKTGARAEAEQAQADAFDDWEQDDRALDQAVYSLDRKCTDWDADHPGVRTRATLFAGAPASDVTGTSRAEEPNEVDKIVARGAALPAEHPGRPVLEQLTVRSDASRVSYRSWLERQTAVATADAALEQAKLAVIAQYRDNVIDLTRAVGEDIAERCFPTLRNRRRKGGAPAPGGDGT